MPVARLQLLPVGFQPLLKLPVLADLQVRQLVQGRAKPGLEILLQVQGLRGLQATSE